MVGVPGRSKGCKTCRQRRVKCTEEKPVCSRCMRGGFECHGYARETVWHHLTMEPSPSEGSKQPALGRLMAVEDRGSDNTAKARSMAHAKMPLMPTQVSLAAFQEDMCFAYIFSNFVWRGYGASWLHQSAQGLLGQLAFDSVKALAEMSFGKSQKSHQTEIQGRLKYGKALRHMVEKLGGGRRGDLRELIVPILLLLMHTGTLTNESAATFHLQAMTRILSVCGPQMFQHQPFRDAFEAARATMVVASLVTRKRVFLDNPAWHTGPYALVPQSKAPQSYLLDILASVPELLENHHNLEHMTQDTQSSTISTALSSDSMQGLVDTDSEATTTSRSNILNCVVAQLESLFVWRLHWQIAFGSDVRAESGTRESSVEFTNGLPGNRTDKLRFSRPVAASDIALYNAVLMWLLALINELEPLSAELIIQTYVEFAFTAQPATQLTEFPSFEPLRGIGSTTQVRDAAMEICRVFEWQSSHHASAAWETNAVYMFPIGLALCVFDREPETRDWIRAMLNTNPLTRDYGVRPDHTSLIGKADTGTLHRLQAFGWYVTRELAAQEGSNEIPNPNLVHLLLLRGRMDVSS
ncbi:hypothetical protein F5Y14DRAFT_442434 [Nemania sp. NC0429]|nr:hypothetical protein F5Y14DRAFT_442434 [Nemania sp. NC0429]